VVEGDTITDDITIITETIMDDSNTTGVDASENDTNTDTDAIAEPETAGVPNYETAGVPTDAPFYDNTIIHDKDNKENEGRR
jgi:hypothetical protein